MKTLFLLLASLAVGFAIPAPDADKDYSDFALPQENLPAIDDVAASDYSLQADASQDYADTLPSENLPTDAESLDDNEGYSADDASSKDYTDSVPQENLPADAEQPILADDNVATDVSKDYIDSVPRENLPAHVEPSQSELTDETTGNIDSSDILQDVNQEYGPDVNAGLTDDLHEDFPADNQADQDTFNVDLELENGGESIPIANFFGEPFQTVEDFVIPDAPDVIPDAPEDEEINESVGEEPLPGYEVPSVCVPTFVNQTRTDEREECFDEVIDVCQDLEKKECKDVCEVVVEEASAVVEKQECKTVTENICTDVPTQVCEVVEVPVTSLVPKEVCVQAVRPNCETKLVDKCEPKTEEVCLPTIDAPGAPLCRNVTEEKCGDPVCRDVLVPTLVPTYSYECKPAERKVCKDASKTVCSKVPKKICKNVGATEMTWVTSDECVNTKRCKRSLDKKTFLHDKIQAKLDKKLWKLGKLGHNCNIVPKCWPVMKWATNPVQKSVCSETWSEECREVREPSCEIIRDHKCERMPMPMNMNITKRICEPDCKRIETVRCLPGAPGPVRKCENVTTPFCEKVEDKVCVEKAESVCKVENQEVVMYEKRSQCETKVEPQCKPVEKKVCKAEPSTLVKSVPKEKCLQVCKPKSVRECNQETKRKCKTVPVQIVVRVPEKTCPKNGKSSSDIPNSDTVAILSSPVLEDHEVNFVSLSGEEASASVAYEGSSNIGSSGGVDISANADESNLNDLEEGNYAEDELENSANADESNADESNLNNSDVVNYAEDSQNVGVHTGETRSDDIILSRSATIP